MISINGLLVENAKKYPNKCAVVCKNKSITFIELKNQVDAFAAMLHDKKVNKGARVAILLENSIEYIICIYGALKYGAIFVPLPYESPDERNLTIIKNCEPEVVITDCKTMERLSNHINNCNIPHIVTLERNDKYVFWEDFINEKKEFIELYNPRDIAYIVYTSGSTGEPKGVAVCNDSLLNMIMRTNEVFKFNENTRYLSMLPFCFDGVFGGIFCPIAVGGCLVLFRVPLITPKLLYNKAVSERITFFGCTPSLFVLLMQYLDRERAKKMNIKIISIGGDFIPKEHVKVFFEVFDDVKLFNRYGPTETTSVVSSYEIVSSDLDRDTSFPIGKPVRNVTFYAFNDKNVLIKPGEKGELFIGGIQLMKEYWRDAELTNSVFIYYNGEKLYRSNDYVTVDAQGQYILLGRSNNMIKRNHYRVFLSEIENALLKCPGVQESICVLDNEILYAFIIRKASPQFNEKTILSKISKYLPNYMIPNKIIIVDRFEFNSIGKVDQKKMIGRITNNNEQETNTNQSNSRDIQFHV